MFVKIILLAFVALAAAEQKRFDGDKVFRLTPENEYQLKFIQQFMDAPSSQFDFWAEPSAINEPVDLRVAADSVSMFAGLLNTSRMAYTIVVDDVQRMIDEVTARDKLRMDQRADTIVGTFPTYQELVDWLASLCTSKPSMASCGDVGVSTEKRTLKYIKLGIPSADGKAKQKIWLEGTMHAREWLGTATVVYLVDRLLSTYNTDPVAKRMLDTYDWYVIPMSNPDGYEYSRTKDRMWRKTRSKSSATCYGADPNRNFGFNWGESGASTSPCSDTYRGTAAFSEPETKAISDFVSANKANSRVYFSIHTYSQYWLIPYGTGKPTAKPADFDELSRVANIGVKALMAVNNKKWVAGNIVDLLYEASGGSIDWAKGSAGIKYTYCLELRPSSGSLNGFVVSATEIDPSGREVWAGLVAAIDAIPN